MRRHRRNGDVSLRNMRLQGRRWTLEAKLSARSAHQLHLAIGVPFLARRRLVSRAADRTQGRASESAAWWHGRETPLAQLLSLPSGRVSRLECSLVDVSSSEIRQSMKSGKGDTEMIPYPVLEYIRHHKLYENLSQTEAVL